MKNSSPKIRTTNLDLACVLVAEGNGCITKKVGPVSAVFEFEENADTKIVAKKFYKGDCTVNVTCYMYARFSLKRELAMKAIEWERARPGKLILNPGEFYYFVADDGKAYRNVYANREPHIQRVLKGNAFRTQNEAQAAAASTKID